MSVTEVEKQVEDPVDVIEPESEAKYYKFDAGDESVVYQQVPLTFFGKMDFFSILGRAIDKAMAGPDGLRLGELLDDSPLQRGSSLSAEDFRDADLFVRGIARVVSYVPDFLPDLFCVILAVPKTQRQLAKQLMEEQLTDEQGVGILETFVDQNWEVLNDFFTQQIGRLSKKVTSKISPDRDTGSARSKRSKSTPRSTQKP